MGFPKLLYSTLLLTLLLLPGCVDDQLSIVMAAVAGTPYTPGETVDIQITFNYVGPDTILAIEVVQSLPDGWTFEEYPPQILTNMLPPLMEEVGNTLSFGYIANPPLPATFVYRVNVPENASGTQEFQGYTRFYFENGVTLSPVTTVTVQQVN